MSGKINYKIIIKAAVIGILLLLMLIPLAFVNGLIKGRLNYKEEALRKITSSWGSEIVVAAPALNVIIETKHVDDKKRETFTTSYRKFTPAELDVKAELIPQVRYIGIFKMPVFTAKVKMKGVFKDIFFVMLNSKQTGEFITLEFNDLKGMASTPKVKFSNGKTAEFEPVANSIPSMSVSQEVSSYYEDSYSYKSYSHSDRKTELRVLGANVPDGLKDLNFEIEFDIRGSSAISFVPLAKQNNFEIVSSWPAPNFSGAFLPDTKDINNDGFKANWAVNYLASGIPSDITGYSFGTMSFKTSLLFPVDNYRNAERAVKYAVLFLALTFLACFVFEIVRKNPVHPFQYALVGIAMAVFYVLLIAFSEFISFGWAYLIAAAATVGLITAYARYAVVKERAPKQVAITAGLLTFLYGYLYMLLQLEDLSLIFGAVGLFLGVGAVMYATRNINWYE